MGPRKRRALDLAHKMCKDCGWYNDCPAEYRCPPMEVIIILMTETPEAKDE